jgi:hypothetical protein
VFLSLAAPAKMFDEGLIQLLTFGTDLQVSGTKYTGDRRDDDL